MTELYRDSISRQCIRNVDFKINSAERMIYNGDYEKAIETLLPLLSDSIDSKRKVYVNYTLSEAYKAIEDTTNQIKYLVSTAIMDIKMAEREYASLQKLALLMYHQGDLDRAYRYLSCSMEDAVAANARLRFLEVTQIYPIIDNAYKKKEAERRNATKRLLIGISVLAFLLIIATFYLYYWMKKLSVMRSNLYKANKKLVEANRNLAQTGRIKEVYIAKYLDRCVGYPALWLCCRAQRPDPAALMLVPQVPYARSEAHLTELLERVCEKMKEYGEKVDPSTVSSVCHKPQYGKTSFNGSFLNVIRYI